MGAGDLRAAGILSGVSVVSEVTRARGSFSPGRQFRARPGPEVRVGHAGPRCHYGRPIVTHRRLTVRAPDAVTAAASRT